MLIFLDVAIFIVYVLVGLDKTSLLDGLQTKITDSSKFKYCPSTSDEKCSFIFMEQVMNRDFESIYYYLSNLRISIKG